MHDLESLKTARGWNTWSSLGIFLTLLHVGLRVAGIHSSSGFQMHVTQEPEENPITFYNLASKVIMSLRPLSFP